MAWIPAFAGMTDFRRSDREPCSFRLAVSSITASIAAGTQLEPYVDLIRCYGIAKRLDDARHVSEIANKQFPDRGDVFVQLGVVIATSGQLEGAKRLFAAALDLTPHLPLALYNLARIADAQGEPGKALRLYRSARAADRESKLPDTNRGDLELKTGAIDAAVLNGSHAIRRMRTCCQAACLPRSMRLE